MASSSPTRSITVRGAHLVASWTWSSSEDVCGICHVQLDGCAPEVEFPGDDSPVGERGNEHTCTQKHMHALSLSLFVRVCVCVSSLCVCPLAGVFSPSLSLFLFASFLSLSLSLPLPPCLCLCVTLSASSRFPPPPEVFDLVARVGGGAYGQVYRALDKRNGSMRAVKILPLDLTSEGLQVCFSWEK